MTASDGQYETMVVRASLGRGPRDLNRWLERYKHLAQDITRRQRSPNPHDSRRR